jgi:hypothetical protein
MSSAFLEHGAQKNKTAFKGVLLFLSRGDDFRSFPPCMGACMCVCFVQKIKSNANENVNDAWLTGIVEVELPVEEKMRNIEETELAKKKMLEDRQRGLISSGFRVDTSSDKGYMRIGQKAKKGTKKEKADGGQVVDASKKLSVLPSQPVHGVVQYEQKREVKDPAAASGLVCMCVCVCVCVCDV